MKRNKIDKKEFLWDFHKKNHFATTTNLRPLFMAIDFTYATLSTNLKLASQFIVTVFKECKPLSLFKMLDFPIKFIRMEIKKYFFMRKVAKNKGKKSYKTIDYCKYEYLVYQQIERGIHAGEVYSNTSIEYKSLDADLALEKNFKKQKEIVQKAYVPALRDDIKGRLDELEDILENMIEVVNQRINNGENKHVKIKKKGNTIKWSLPYQKIKPDFNNPFYDKLPQTNIVDLLVFVDKQCNFTSAFGHIRSYKSAKEANNIIIAEIEKLLIFKYYNIDEDSQHGSADGRKVDVRLNTFKSRYLRKYFKEKGVSSYTLLMNNIAIDSKIITGHESHFLFDVLFNNTSNIRPNIVSTDNEGSNQLNFILLDLIEVIFAPHYKTITKKAKSICTFKDPKHYQNHIIKPYRQSKRDLIIEEWPNIQQIFVSVLSGEQTQSVIVSKLSSHKRKNKTKDALWEYNNILMSIYLLWYIDDVELRRHVRKSLNRIEGYHQLIRAITNVGGGELRGKSEMEILIWNECSHLVANAIIYYNAYMLSQILMSKISKGEKIDEKAINLLKRISPIAWQHLIFIGSYDFRFKNSINIHEILAVIGRCFDEELLKTNQKSK